MGDCPFCLLPWPPVARCTGCGLAVCADHFHPTGEAVWPVRKPLGECPECAHRRHVFGNGDRAWDEEAVLAGRLKALEAD